MTASMPVMAPAPAQANAAIVATDIPARLDRLRWGRFHTLVVVALGAHIYWTLSLYLWWAQPAMEPSSERSTT